MVEVFKTNVDDLKDAAWLIAEIGRNFSHYQANFDLEDCDRILRVKCIDSAIDNCALISILTASGFEIEVLEDGKVLS